MVEAQALSSKIHCEWMQVPVGSLAVTGGASANSQILRVFADVHGCPVCRFQTPNAAALGAALRACHGFELAAGREPDWSEVVAPFTRSHGETIAPDAAAHEVYTERVEAYRRLEQLHAS